ncbi:hypothetical protein SAMN05421803_1526 [Nocardiopsis flavescens]|uniref:Uncharacterized protein n=1 Tax=Nocardiopsis flavescens TaxID=758803 RepID=A0A1M6WVH7_9ACTN|nr:hypothetical protein [Nocardiopsis flavescens]SHK97780.1 hypothetical protein SAMN05421803_1526 [Nocardiopsis flavescens]
MTPRIAAARATALFGAVTLAAATAAGHLGHLVAESTTTALAQLGPLGSVSPAGAAVLGLGGLVAVVIGGHRG